MEYHESANLFPLMEGDEFNALVEDIKAHGLIEPIILFNNQILDGRNRYRACILSGTEPIFKEYNGTQSAYDFVISENLVRRHLSTSQRIGLALKLLPQEEVKAKEREYSGKDPSAILRQGISGKSSEIVGNQLNVSPRYVQEAKKLQEKNPDIQDKLISGELTLQDAKREVLKIDRQNRIESIKESIADIPSNIEVLNTDSLEWLATTNKTFDCIITDPPYNTGRMDWDVFDSIEHYIDWMALWLELAVKRLNDRYHVFICCPSEYVADIEVRYKTIIDKPKSRIVWSHRNLSQGRVVTNAFAKTYEVILHYGNTDLNFDDKWSDKRFDVQNFAAPQTNFSDTKLHQTQKPLDLIKWLVESGSLPGDIILDPFGGSGTTALACAQLDRNCICIDKEQEYCDITKGRLSEYYKQLPK